MLDPALLRNKPEEVIANLEKRNAQAYKKEIEHIKNRGDARKKAQMECENLRAKRNDTSRKIGTAMAQGDAKAVAKFLAQAAELKEESDKAEVEFQATNTVEHTFLRNLPNLLHHEVPDGKSEENNDEVRRKGEIPVFDFEVKDHVAIGVALSVGAPLAMMDFEQAAKIASARFVTLSGALAQLHRALAQWMMDLHTREHGYTEMYLPMLVNQHAAFGTGQLPKFSDDLFAAISGKVIRQVAADLKEEGNLQVQTHLDLDVAANNPLYAIPTAEVPMTNVARERIFEAGELPLKMVAHTPCFRREAGAHGKDTRGMLRQHQFDKVELVHITEPGDSYRAHEELTSNAEAVLQKLKLPYRVVTLCAGDTGFAAAKTYDLEVWLPGQNAYREISSCSNCESFQARRMMARCRDKNNKTQYAHTLNGSGVAVGRAMIAVLENNQRKDGSVEVPEVLRPYMNGAEVISGK